MNILMLLAEEQVEVTPVQMIVFLVVMAVVVFVIFKSTKKQSTTVPKQVSDKYDIKETVQFGKNMICITDDKKLLVQDSLKWFEFDPSLIVKGENKYDPVNKQINLTLTGENGKTIKGTKIFGGGVAVKSTKSFFVYHYGAKNETVFAQGNKVLEVLRSNFGHIEI